MHNNVSTDELVVLPEASILATLHSISVTKHLDGTRIGSAHFLVTVSTVMTHGLAGRNGKWQPKEWPTDEQDGNDAHNRKAVNLQTRDGRCELMTVWTLHLTRKTSQMSIKDRILTERWSSRACCVLHSRRPWRGCGIVRRRGRTGPCWVPHRC